MLKKLYNKSLKLFKKYKETILYLVFGGLTTLINIVVYQLFSKPLQVNYLISNAIAWVVSVLFAFVTNKLFVFESKSMNTSLVIKELALFVSARLLSGAMDMGIMYVFIDVLHYNDLLIKVLSNVIVILVNYVLSKLIIFKQK